MNGTMRAAAESEITIVGGGIGGLALALNLHKHKISCRVYEAAPSLKELGVGITVLPHAMRELTALGLGETVEKLGIENTESRFFNRFGQLTDAEFQKRNALASQSFINQGITFIHQIDLADHIGEFFTFNFLKQGNHHPLKESVTSLFCKKRADFCL